MRELPHAMYSLPSSYPAVLDQVYMKESDCPIADFQIYVQQ